MVDGVWPDQRAGWWRRSLGLAVDVLCVAIPSAVAGAALFAMTGGALQWSNPFLQWQVCQGLTAIPAGLDPPPPENSNAAQVCQLSSIAGTVGRALTVTRVTKTEKTTSSIGRTYPLLNTGQQGGHDLSWLSLAALLILLVFGEWRTGLTPGKRLLGIRVVTAAAPDARSVPLKQVAVRYGIAIGVYALLFGALFGFLFLATNRLDEPPPYAFAVMAVLIVATSAWSLWNLVRIIRRRQTVYDAYAGVEVIRPGRPGHAAVTATPPGPA